MELMPGLKLVQRYHPDFAQADEFMWDELKKCPLNHFEACLMTILKLTILQAEMLRNPIQRINQLGRHFVSFLLLFLCQLLFLILVSR